MGLYLLFLASGDDTEFKLVDESTFHWVVNGGTPSESIVEEIRRDHPNWTDEKVFEEYFDFGGSSPDNDRALVAASIKINDKEMYFFHIKDFLSALKEHNIVINEVYEGTIY